MQMLGVSEAVCFRFILKNTLLALQNAFSSNLGDVKPELFFLLNHGVALRRPYIKFRFFRYTSVTCLYMYCSMKNEKFVNTLSDQ